MLDIGFSFTPLNKKVMTACVSMQQLSCILKIANVYDFEMVDWSM